MSLPKGAKPAASILILILLVAASVIWIIPTFQPLFQRQTIVVVQGGQTKTLAEAWSEMNAHYKNGQTELRLSDKQLLTLLSSESWTTKSIDELFAMEGFAKFVTMPNVLDPKLVPAHSHPLLGALGVKMPCRDFVLTVETHVQLQVNGKVVAEAPENYDPDKGGMYLASTVSGYIAHDTFLGLMDAVGSYLTGHGGASAWHRFDIGTTMLPFHVNQDVSSEVAKYPDGTKITIAIKGYQVWNIFPFYASDLATAWLPPWGGSLFLEEGSWGLKDNKLTYDQKWEFTKGAVTQPDFLLSFVDENQQPIQELVVGKDNQPAYGTLGIQTLNSFSETITFKSENVSTGVTVSFGQPSWTPPVGMGMTRGGIKVSVRASAEAKNGTDRFTVIAQSSSQTHSITINIRIIEGATPPPNPLLEHTVIQFDELGKIIIYMPFTVSGKLLSSVYRTPVVGRTMTLTSSWDKQTVTVTTDEGGRFSHTYYAPATAGIYTITAKFEGDNLYLATDKTLNFSVSALPFPIDWLWIILVVLVIVAVAAYYAYSKRKKAMPTVTSS